MVSSGGFISLESYTNVSLSIPHSIIYMTLPLSWSSVSICSPLSSSGGYWSMLEPGVSVSWLTNLLMLSRSSVSSHVHIQHTHAAAAYQHKCRNKLDRRNEEHSAQLQLSQSQAEYWQLDCLIIWLSSLWWVSSEWRAWHDVCIYSIHCQCNHSRYTTRSCPSWAFVCSTQSYSWQNYFFTFDLQCLT